MKVVVGQRGRGKNAHLETLSDEEWGIGGWLKMGRRTKVLSRTPGCPTLVLVVVTMADTYLMWSSGREW